MYLMAGSTGNIPIRMGTTGPVHALSALVTGKAGAISIFNRVGRILSKCSGRIKYFLRIVPVAVTLAMTAGAGGRASICNRPMPCFADREYRTITVLIVTSGACGVAPENQVFSRFFFRIIHRH